MNLERALEVIDILSFGRIVDLDQQYAIHAAQISNELKLAMAASIITELSFFLYFLAHS